MNKLLLTIGFVLIFTLFSSGQNFDILAEDDASDYSSAWSSGSNEGSGFEAWALVQSGNNVGFAGSYLGNTAIGDPSFGLYSGNNSAAFSTAERGFTEALEPGDVFSVVIGHTASIANGGEVGLVLLEGTDVVLTLKFVGGGSSWFLNDGGSDFGIAQGFSADTPLTFQFTFEGDNQYSYEFGAASGSDFTFNGTVNDIDGVRFLNRDQGSSQNSGINNLEIKRPTFTTIADGDFNSPATWDGGFVPDGKGVITIAHDVNLDGDLNLSGSLTINTGNTLGVNDDVILTNNGSIAVNGDLTLKSSTNGTAQYGNSTGLLTGDVTVERFIPAKRAFRFISAAVSGVSIENAWQQDTHITGTGGATNGFDETTTNNPSMFTFNNSLVNQSAGASWTNVTSTTATNLSAGTPYRLFVRGDRTVDLSNNEAIASDVTLSAKGSLQTGSFTAIVSQANENFSFIGNPYQAIVDLSQLTFGSGIVSNFAYYWDPSLADNGAFVTIDIAAGTSEVELPATGSSNANQYLQPGQAVFFRNDDSGTDYTIAFEEADKATSESPLSVFSTDESPFTSPYINLRLYETTKFNTGAKEQDAIGFRFYTNGNDAIDNTDAYKLGNSAENLAIINSVDLFSIEERALPTLAHELQLFVNNYQHEDYTYRFDVQNFGDDIQPVFVDQYTQATYPLVEGIQTIQFTVDASISQSMNNQRFSIQFDNVNLSQTVFTKNDFSIYPNPAQDVLNINWNTATSEETQISIFNITGHKVAEFTQDSVLKTISLPIQNLDAGVYLLQTQNNEMNLTKKFIKR